MTQLQPLQYQSRATVMVGASIRDPNPDGDEIYLAQQLVNTYVDLVQRDSVRGPAMAALGLTWLPAYTARQVPNTQLMELTVLDTDPVRAQAVAQALVDQLIQISPAGAEEQQRAQFIETELTSLQSCHHRNQGGNRAPPERAGRTCSARARLRTPRPRSPRLENKLSSLQSNFTALLATTQKGAVNALTVIELPSPGAAVDRGLLFKLLTAAAIGFLLAAGGAYLIEYLDNSFKNSDEVQQKLGLPTLGAIPVLEGKDRDKQLVMLDESHSAAAESFRVLRTNLQFSAVAHPLHSLVVTSPLPSEGKSVVSANLAVAAAQAGNRVVLIDCDLHRPRQHKVFGLVNNVGVTTALLAADAADPEQFLQPRPAHPAGAHQRPPAPQRRGVGGFPAHARAAPPPAGQRGYPDHRLAARFRAGRHGCALLPGGWPVAGAGSRTHQPGDRQTHGGCAPAGQRPHRWARCSTACRPAVGGTTTTTTITTTTPRSTTAARRSW